MVNHGNGLNRGQTQQRFEYSLHRVTIQPADPESPKQASDFWTGIDSSYLLRLQENFTYIHRNSDGQIRQTRSETIHAVVVGAQRVKSPKQSFRLIVKIRPCDNR